MFSELTKYLFEHRSLAVPGIGVFNVRETSANIDHNANTIQAPVWEVSFNEKIEEEPIDDTDLYIWLEKNEHISKDKARELFENFSGELESRLNAGENAVWEGLGSLYKTDGHIFFTPQQVNFNPFTNVSAQKIKRKNVDFTTLVGDKEFTATESRERLAELEQKAPRRNVALWILLSIAIFSIICYFMQSGCNKSATGNRQHLETSKPVDTYKLQ